MVEGRMTLLERQFETSPGRRLPDIQRRLPDWLLVGLLATLCVIAYAPAINNGFIADDYVILQRTEILKHDPWYLFNVVPENFRATSYVVFGGFRAMFGYDARWFYPFTIFLHLINCFLFYKLLRRLEAKSALPWLAAILFAVFQAQQEAVMWLAAMNECLQALFILTALLFWDKRRYGWSVVCFSLALVSKESAAILLVMIPLWQLIRKKPLSKAYLLFFIPASIFAVMFLYTVSRNFMLTSRAYVIGFQAPIVVLKTLFRLTWPWLYILIAIALVVGVGRFQKAKVGSYAAWLAVPMLPYMFIHYQHHLPSRQLYLAAMVFTCLIADLLSRVPVGVRTAFVAAFMIFNVQYLWFKKEPQFVERAASTSQFVAELKRHTPSKILLIDFPYPQIGIPQAATLAVPGWSPDLVEYGSSAEQCMDCLVLRWDGNSLRPNSR